MRHRRDAVAWASSAPGAAPTRSPPASRSTGRSAPAARRRPPRTTTTRPPTTTTRPPTTTTTRPPDHHDHDATADDPAHQRLEPAGQPGHPAQRGVAAPGEHVPATCTASATTAGTRSWPTAGSSTTASAGTPAPRCRAALRDQIHNALSRQFAKWMNVMAGPQRLAVHERAGPGRRLGRAGPRHAAVERTTRSTSTSTTSARTRRSAPSHADGSSTRTATTRGCPGGAARHYDMSLWLTAGLRRRRRR